MGAFLYDICTVQHCISHRLGTNHPYFHPATEPPKDIATMCVAIGPVFNTCSMDLKIKAYAELEATTDKSLKQTIMDNGFSLNVMLLLINVLKQPLKALLKLLK